MMDIGDICDYCEDRECELCIYGNPCLGCEDYSGHGICLSKGGCGKESTEAKNERTCERHGNSKRLP